MAYKPILFNTEMVQAIQAGRKTQTRRLVKEIPLHAPYFELCDGTTYACDMYGEWHPAERFCRIQPGDILWVREKWQHVYNFDDGDQLIEGTGRYVYYADNPMPFDYWVDPDTGEHKEQMPWKPSIHMPKEAARLFLRVKDVRVERLQSITDADAHSEGVPEIGDYPIKPVYCPRCKGEGLIGGHIGHGYVEVDCPDCRTNVQRFSHLWDSTIKPADLDKYGWAADPWVWVVEFERCDRPEGWCS
ncbi:MAG: hypothetical protein IKK34_14390 [Clostridia bacterium]|nr:hypothetical protein [Clostridia bacterium]